MALSPGVSRQGSLRVLSSGWASSSSELGGDVTWRSGFRCEVRLDLLSVVVLRGREVPDKAL